MSCVLGGTFGYLGGKKLGSLANEYVSSGSYNGGGVNYKYESKELIGSLVGLGLGTIIGALIGSNSVVHIDIDFSKIDRPEKVKQLKKLSK
jgi:hypothetical protein